MTHSVDLGRARFRTTNSNTHLHFAASARFRLSSSPFGLEMPIALEDWPDVEDIWITEAPELELRFVLRTDSTLGAATSTLISQLGDKLCGSRMLSDLGFAMTLKSCDNTINAESHGACRLTFGLRRRPQGSSLVQGRRVPTMLRDPPDFCPPCTIPSISLVSVDIAVEFGCEPECKERHTQPHDSDTDRPKTTMLSVLTCLSRCSQLNSIGTGEETEIPASLVHSFSGFGYNHRPYFSPLNTFSSIPHSEIPGIRLTHELLQLLDFGFQKLTISASIKHPQIQEVGVSSVQNLSEIAPAVFSPGYRDIMNQRAMSIPVLSKAVCSMATSSNDMTLQSKISTLLQASRNPLGPSSLKTRDMKSIIEASFWRIAQENLRRPYTSRKPKPFFTATSFSNTHVTDECALPFLFAQTAHLENPSPESDHCLDIDEVDAENYDDCFWEMLEEGTHEAPISGHLDDDGEGSFVDIGESTQSTVYDCLSTCGFCPPPASDSEMLLPDHEGGIGDCVPEAAAECVLYGEIEMDNSDMLCE